MNPYDDLENRGHVQSPGCPCKPCQEYFRQKPSEPAFIHHTSENGLSFRHHTSQKKLCWLCIPELAQKTP